MLKTTAHRVVVVSAESDDPRQELMHMQRAFALAELEQMQRQPCPVCKATALALAHVEFRDVDDWGMESVYTYRCADCETEITGASEFRTPVYRRVEFSGNETSESEESQKK